MVEETELLVRIGLVVFAIADIFAETDCGEKASQPGGIAFFGGIDFLLRGCLDICDLIGRSTHDQDISDFYFAVLAGRNDRCPLDRDLIGGRVLQDHDLAVVLVFEDHAFAGLFDCRGYCPGLSGGGFF
jgi:hypothetical protein